MHEPSLIVLPILDTLIPIRFLDVYRSNDMKKISKKIQRIERERARYGGGISRRDLLRLGDLPYLLKGRLSSHNHRGKGRRQFGVFLNNVWCREEKG